MITMKNDISKKKLRHYQEEGNLSLEPCLEFSRRMVEARKKNKVPKVIKKDTKEISIIKKVGEIMRTKNLINKIKNYEKTSKTENT